VVVHVNTEVEEDAVVDLSVDAVSLLGYQKTVATYFSEKEGATTNSPISKS
jgi:hypothetical protein